MWIRKKLQTHKLYRKILFYFVISAVVSIIMWQGLARATENFIIDKNRDKIAEDKIEMDDHMKSVSEEIAKGELSINQVIEKRILEDLNAAELRIVDNDGNIRTVDKHDKDGEEEFNLSSERSIHVYPIKFKEGEGLILVKPQSTYIFRGIYGFATAGALCFFVFMSIMLVGKQLKYIEEINRGIGEIGGGTLTYKIPEKGDTELTNLAKSINDMSESLHNKIEQEKLADLKQRRLITNLSHDLRTPLTAVIGYLNILSDKKYESKEEALEYLERAKQKSHRLQNLLNDLFAYTKLTNRDMACSLRKVDPQTFILQYLETQSQKVDVKIGTDIGSIMVDIGWMNRILDNLFDNISKYGVEDSTVEVFMVKEEDYIVIRVSNESRENLEGKVEYLFDRMYVGQEERSRGASGLGLAIVSEYMKQMNGGVEAHYKMPMLEIILRFPITE